MDEDKVEIKYTVELQYGVSPDDAEFVHYKDVVMPNFTYTPMFKPGDLVTAQGFDAPTNPGTFEVTKAAMAEVPQTEAEKREQHIIDALGIIETSVDYGAGIEINPPLGVIGDSLLRMPKWDQPKITCKMRPKPGERAYAPNDLVQVDGQRVGRVVSVGSDGVVEILMDGPGQGGIVGKPCPWDLTEIENDPKSVGSRDPAAQRFIDKFITPTERGTCDECKGTGYYTGLNESTPCSKGCKPA